MDLSHHRWTVDYPEDLAFAERVLAALVPTRGGGVLMSEILEFLEGHPDVVAINAARAHR